MKFDIITIFPQIIQQYCANSLLGKAQNKVLKINTHNLRDFTGDKHKTTDDKPFGGGRGMVMKAEPIIKAVAKIKGKSQAKVILFSPRGKKFNQKMAHKWSKEKQIILICSRYEGADERINYLADEVVSVGDYVLMGAELPALIVVESVARLLKGVVGHSESLIQERIAKQGGFIEYPQYTRPEVIKIKGKNRKVPKVLLSGNHKQINDWRKKHTKVIE